MRIDRSSTSRPLVTRLWNLTPMFAMGAAVLLLVGAVAVGVLREEDYRSQKLDEVDVQARILADAVTAALAFDDPATAQTYVNALAANPELAAAAVYQLDGRRFVSFARPGAEPLPEQVTESSAAFRGHSVEVTLTVVQQDTPLGYVYLRSTAESLLERTMRSGGRVFLGLMALLLLGVIVAAQAMLNRANAELAHRAREVEQANATLRDQIAHRERAEEVLRQAQKMESIGHLTGGVAHDFNNLLAIILGNLERAERRLAAGADRGEVRSALAAARSGADRAATLTRSLLAFARRQPLRPQPIDVNRLVTGMSELLLRTLGDQVTVESVIAGGLWRTLVDRNQLESALLNLALNARDAMPEGGKLTIETANAYLDERYAADHEEIEAGQYVLICVTDTGTGMPPEVVERAFEPFFTTKDVGHGTGLGLSQVYGLVKQSGGHIKIYSEPGEGTTFKIYLPRLVESEVPEAVEETGLERVAAPARSSATLLVVEDDAGMRAHSVDLLREIGYPVLAAGDGESALRLLDAHPEVELLFTDVGLPGGMNGRQLADEARRRRPGLAVLFTTAYARNAIVHDGRLDPGVRLVTKPFTFEQLAHAVAEALQPDAPAVLLVEDEALVRIDTAAVLRELGCEPLEAATAAAQGLLRERGGRVDAALIDLGLPDNQGDAIVAALRQEWPRLPLIVASGAGAASLRDELRDDPLVQVLPKPYLPSSVEASLRSVGVTPQPPAS